MAAQTTPPDQPCGGGGNHGRSIDGEITTACFGHGLEIVEPKCAQKAL